MNNTPLQIGITGGIGAGKSVVSRIFKILGAPVYDADQNARKLMNEDKALVAAIKGEFGAESYLNDGTLNRQFVSALAFGSPEKLTKLNGLVHPRVADDYKDWASRQNSFPYLLKEAALLFETGSFNGLDAIIVVSAPEELRIRRVLRRDPQRTEQQAKDIISNQMPERDKIVRGEFIIVNDENTLVIDQVLEIDKELKERQRSF